MAQEPCCLLRFLIATVLIGVISAAPTDKTVNTYDVEYGVYLGQLSNSANSLVSGRVFVVNESTLQVIDFSYTGKPNEAYFWLSSRSDVPNSNDGVRVPTFEFGFTPLDTIETKRIVLNLPGNHKIGEFKGLHVYSPSGNIVHGSVPIPSDVLIPKTHFLPKELSGSRYSVHSGPILILDTRTIKVFGFTFDGDKAPDGYFFVGRGLTVSHEAGVKVPIRGRDQPDLITPMNIKYRGGKDIIIDLPENYDVYHIDFLSVYCYKFRVDFAHVPINNLPAILPPYVPVQHRFAAKTECDSPWKAQPLLGTEARTNFTIQLGPPGGHCGYRSITGMRANEYVWYVNGYMAELYMKRGFNYTFNVEGGRNNSFYISDDPFGGYSTLEPEEKKQITIFVPKDDDDLEDAYSERLCLWEGGVDPETADKYTFQEFRRHLHLTCIHQEEAQNVLKFSPDNSTPSVVYGNSLDHYGMGFVIHVVDEFPTEIQDIHEEPFTFEAWTHNVNTASNSVFVNSAFIFCLFPFLFLLNIL